MRARCRPSSAPSTRPVEIGGVAVGEGEKVLMFLGAANC